MTNGKQIEFSTPLWNRLVGDALTIGELLSLGDDTSMLDSSSWTSPYILPTSEWKKKLNAIHGRART